MNTLDLENLARRHTPFGLEVRRHLHQYPELSFEEEKTAAYVAAKLQELGYEPQTGIGGGYSIKAVLKGAKPGKTIALRADFDALPITEESGLPYASSVPGVMHACGHDMHTGALLATAAALKEMQADLTGTVVFLFQAAEETPPGGAIEMVRAGVMENPKVDTVFALHVDSFLPAGQLSLVKGPMLAASDTFDIRIQGRGGHGAAPHNTVDAVLVGSQVVNALQHIHSRQVSPFERLVITIGHFQAGTKHNIIADQALLQGTVRTMSPELRDQIPGLMERVIGGVCGSYGASFELEYFRGYPVLINDEAMTDLAWKAAVATVGEEAVLPEQPGMYGDDFAYFLQERPGCMLHLGVADPGAEQCYPVHHPRLMVADEQAMPVGIGFYLNLVASFLGQE